VLDVEAWTLGREHPADEDESGPTAKKCLCRSSIHHRSAAATPKAAAAAEAAAACSMYTADIVVQQLLMHRH